METIIHYTIRDFQFTVNMETTSQQKGKGNMVKNV